jgi:hypothetical protein
MSPSKKLLEPTTPPDHTDLSAQPPVVADKELDETLDKILDKLTENDRYRQSKDLAEAKAALLQREQRLVAEARIDELGRAYPEMMKHRGLYGEGNYYYDDRIAQLRHNTNTGKGKLE